MTTLIVDLGETVIGVYCVEDDTYIPYREPEYKIARNRIATADEVVTFNGEEYDLWMQPLSTKNGSKFLLSGVHTDMKIHCYGIWGCCGTKLRENFELNFGNYEIPSRGYTDKYVVSNWEDVFMTLKLWELHRRKALKVPAKSLR